MENPDDRQLLQALSDGDRHAAEALVERTYNKIYGALFRLCGDGDLAADLTQETYRRAWVALEGFRGKSSFSTWLYRIAYTTFLNHLRRPRPVTALEEEVIAALPDASPDPEQRARSRRETDRLRNAVLKLPEPLRFTVTGRFWSELSVRELALLEKVTAVAIRKRLKKAMGLLALALQEERS